MFIKNNPFWQLRENKIPKKGSRVAPGSKK